MYGDLADTAPRRQARRPNSDSVPDAAHHSPCIRLWAAVVRRAVVDAKLYPTSSKLRSAKVGDDARAWLDGKYDPEAFNSFDSVCDLMGLKPEVVRDHAEALTEERARRQRGMEFDAE